VRICPSILSGRWVSLDRRVFVVMAVWVKAIRLLLVEVEMTASAIAWSASQFISVTSRIGYCNACFKHGLCRLTNERTNIA